MLISSRTPNFFIIGAAKAGTTTLYDLIIQHPDIFLSSIKEPQFFCSEKLFSMGFEHYIDTHFKNSEGFSARGEATPHYLFYEKAARRISEIIPKSNQRFIVLLRDPVKRAYSHYWNMVAEGLESYNFEDAIAEEEYRSNNSEFDDNCSLRYRYVSGSRYAGQIKKYFKYFKSDQFLFLIFAWVV